MKYWEPLKNMSQKKLESYEKCSSYIEIKIALINPAYNRHTGARK